MADDPAGTAARIRERIDRVRRNTLTLRGTPIASAPDALTALAATIRTDDPAAALSLARSWLDAAAQAASAPDTTARGDAALALLARVFGVSTNYFTDADVARAVDDELDLIAGALRSGVTYQGPCRAALPENDLRSIQARVIHELDQRGARTK